MAVDSVNGENNSKLQFPGKIAIITNLPYHTQNDEESWSARQVVAKYGSENVIHLFWPVYFFQEKEQMDVIVSKLLVNEEIKAIITNQAIPECNTVFEKLKKARDDVFIVYCMLHEKPAESAGIADLILMPNDLGMGPVIVKQARKQGATAFVHYSFPRHLAIEHRAACRDLMRETCIAEGMEFVGATAIDPMGEGGVYNAGQFITDDVPRMVAKYGENTAFYSTNCFIQVPLIKAVCDSHAIFPQLCCPSPYHGFPEALGIKTGEGMPDLNYIINETFRIAANKNMHGRLSTWPVPLSMMFTNVGAEYAIRWIKGEVPKTGIDDKALMECMTNYIKETTGKDISVNMTPFSEGGKTYNNLKILLMDYLDY